MASAAKKLKTQIATWRSLCPEDLSEIGDVGKACDATDKLEGELTSAKSQLQRKPANYEGITADEISDTLKTLKIYSKELRELEKRLGELKGWLAKVRASANPLPFALVAKGNSKGSLHVFKQESRVERGARSGKQEISGAKIHEGECLYDGGKLVFKFNDGPRASWKVLLQNLVKQAGVSMKVALDGLGDDDQTPA